MARSLPEWIGKSDNTRAPKRVRDRIRERHPTCYLCTRPFVEGEAVALDHVTALINGGENRESNLRPVHVKCHAEKTAEDVAEKARVAAKRQASRRIVDTPAKPIQGQGFAIPKDRAAKIASRLPKLPVANNSHMFRVWQASTARKETP